MLKTPLSTLLFLYSSPFLWADAGVMGSVRDLNGQLIADATVRLANGVQHEIQTDKNGRFEVEGLIPGRYTITAEASTLRPVTTTVELRDGVTAEITLQFTELATVHESIVITATSVEPQIDCRNEEVFNRTLFTRDDQIFQRLSAGINAGQHEGGGKSLEIRRFGFNMDHGGVNGGLKVLLDDVQQTRAHKATGRGTLAR